MYFPQELKIKKSGETPLELAKKIGNRSEIISMLSSEKNDTAGEMAKLIGSPSMLKPTPKKPQMAIKIDNEVNDVKLIVTPTIPKIVLFCEKLIFLLAKCEDGNGSAEY